MPQLPLSLLLSSGMILAPTEPNNLLISDYFLIHQFLRH